MRTLDLTPLFRSTIGFDRFGDMFDMAMRGEDNASAYPPYNIEKTSDDDYRIVLALAGFKDEDITITLQENQLTIAGQHHAKQEKEETHYLYKGIANRAFERKFNLADYMKVQGATLEDGMLTVSLVREVPESVKPRTIEINGKKPQMIN